MKLLVERYIFSPQKKRISIHVEFQDFLKTFKREFLKKEPQKKSPNLSFQ